MASTTTGKDRFFGATAMQYMTELRRRAVVGTSEVDESVPASASDFPRTVDVLRREVSAAGNPALGVARTWTTVVGLTDLVSRVRTNGEWVDKETGHRVELGEADRIVTLLDVPAAGEGDTDQLLPTDRLSFTDPVYGTRSWEIKQATTSTRDGIAVAVVTLAREEAA